MRSGGWSGTLTSRHNPNVHTTLRSLQLRPLRTLKWDCRAYRNAVWIASVNHTIWVHFVRSVSVLWRSSVFKGCFQSSQQFVVFFPHFEVQHLVVLDWIFQLLNLLLLFFDGSAILRKVTKPRHQASPSSNADAIRSKILFCIVIILSRFLRVTWTLWRSPELTLLFLRLPYIYEHSPYL